ARQWRYGPMPAGGGRRHVMIHIHYMVPALLPIQSLGGTPEGGKGKAKRGDRAGAGDRARWRSGAASGTVPRALYNTPTLAYRNDDGFAVLAQRRIAQDLA